MKKIKILILSIIIIIICITNILYLKNKNVSDLALLNIEALAFPEWDRPEPGKIKDVRPCQLNLGGGWFTSSVELFMCRPIRLS